jgi:hypothetical protein
MSSSVLAGSSYYSYPQGGYSSDTSRATLMSDYYTAHQQMPGRQRKVSEGMRINSNSDDGGDEGVRR